MNGSRRARIERVASHVSRSIHRGWKLAAARVALVALLLVAWQVVSTAGDLTFYLSTPGKVLSRLEQWLSDGTIQYNLRYTLRETLMGFALGASLGLTIGLILGLKPFIARTVEPVIIGLYSIPIIALAPLFVVWFGIGMGMKVALASVIVLFLTMFNTISGVSNVDQELLDVLRLMGAGRTRTLREVILPSALTSIFIGLRTSVPYALIGAVTGEILTSNRGVGFLIMQSSNQLDTAGVFAAILILSVVGTAIYMILRASEGRLLRWKRAGHTPLQ